ncbi:uncharacterized membrane protein C3orf80 homolog [Sceloporus undulatus]|uniref:uncharacterized membrane protein C3orf80 homolog n=1 Tax=Sceloporus undulatus TaxID=8520 RepID=UPI001C4B7C7D|nr:uncharacterized membrane protein C3orf80 homolog [Sceloporus undulatus]
MAAGRRGPASGSRAALGALGGLLLGQGCCCRSSFSSGGNASLCCPGPLAPPRAPGPPGSSSSSSLGAWLETAGWLVRKLSGLLILGLLFGVGCFLQRLICPRARARGSSAREQELESPGEGSSSSEARGREASSQDSLLEPPPPPAPASPPFFLRLPSYEEVKELPSYEESLRGLPLGRRDPAGEAALQLASRALS